MSCDKVKHVLLKGKLKSLEPVSHRNDTLVKQEKGAGGTGSAAVSPQAGRKNFATETSTPTVLKVSAKLTGLEEPRSTRPGRMLRKSPEPSSLFSNSIVNARLKRSLPLLKGVECFPSQQPRHCGSRLLCGSNFKHECPSPSGPELLAGSRNTKVDAGMPRTSRSRSLPKLRPTYQAANGEEVRAVEEHLQLGTLSNPQVCLISVQQLLHKAPLAPANVSKTIRRKDKLELRILLSEKINVGSLANTIHKMRKRVEKTMSLASKVRIARLEQIDQQFLKICQHLCPALTTLP